MRRSFACFSLFFLGPYGIFPLTLCRRRLQMFYLSFFLSLSVFFFLSISHSLPLSFAEGLRLVSVFVGATHGPNSPTCHRECMQCSCVFSLAPPPGPSPLPSCCSAYKWIHQPLCVMRHVFKPDT